MKHCVLFHLKPWRQHWAGWPQFSVKSPLGAFGPEGETSTSIRRNAAALCQRQHVMDTCDGCFQSHAALVGSEQPAVLLVCSHLGSHGDSSVYFAPRNVSVPSVFRQTATAAAATSLCQMMESQRTEQVFIHKTAAQRFWGDYSV